MVMTSPDFNTKFFNSLPDMNNRQVAEQFLDDKAEILGDVIRQHGLQGKVGVLRVHNHFPLTGNEKVVASLPSLMDDEYSGLLLGLQNIKIEPREVTGDESQALLPYMFSWNSDVNRLEPLQFFAKDATLIQDRLNFVAAQPDFIAAFVAKLQELKSTKTLGFYIHYEDLLQHGDKHDGMTEFSYQHSRVQRLFTNHEVDDSYKATSKTLLTTTTQWGFTDHGMFQGRMYCARSGANGEVHWHSH